MLVLYLESVLLRVGSSQPNPRFVEAALRDFASIDANDDGVLDKDEVLLSLTNPKLKGDAAAIAATLYRQDHGSGLSRVVNDSWGPERGVSRSDLEALPSCSLSEKFEKRYQDCLSAVDSASEQLFTGQPLPEAVRQGGVSDCWWLSSVTGKAATDPESIQHAFEQLEDGRYRVSFPDGKVVEIEPPTAAECAAFASSGTSGHWLTALEKARGVANQTFLPEKIVQRNLESASLSRGICQVTGDGADQDWLLWTSTDTTRSKMQAHLEVGDVVVAATGPGLVPRLTGRGRDLKGLVPMHAYSVLAYDQPSDTLTLRNPYGDTEWLGGQSGPDDGTFRMPLADFHDLFSLVAYQEPA